MCEHETFFTLLRDPAHWEFEVFLVLLIDGFVLGVLWRFAWPWIKKHLSHHECPPEEKEITHESHDRCS